MCLSAKATGAFLLSGLALMMAATLLDNVAVHGVLVSSDSLLPVAFIRDLLDRPSTWTAFQLPRVPSLFPDLVLYGSLQAAVGSWRLAVALWVVLVMAWLMGIGSWIAARVGRTGLEAAAHPFALLTVVVLVAAALSLPHPERGLDGSGYTYPYLFVFVLVTHGGPFLLALTTAVLAWHAARQPRAWKLLLLGVAAWANGVSDLLCVTSLLAPLCAALFAAWLVRAVPWRTMMIACGIACAGAAAGWACTLLIHRQSAPPLQAAVALANALRFARDLPGRPGILLAGVGLVVPVAVLIHREGWRSVLGTFWPVFAAVSAGSSLVVAIIMYEEVWSFRYALPFLWWPLILTAGVAAGPLRRWAPLPAHVTAAVAGILIGGYLAKGWHAPGLLAWRSPLADCLAANRFRAGLGDYWTARMTSAASDWQLQVEQITRRGDAFLWGNNSTWYSMDIHDRQRPPPFRFIVLNRLDPALIRETYGEPDGVLDCAGSMVWTYEDSDRLRIALHRVSPGLAVRKPQ